MSHEIYTTKGFIVSSKNKGESDKTFFVFTKDLGLIRASAQGVRKLESKLRYSLQDFSFTDVSLVMTKTGWRITNASILESSTKVSTNSIKVKTLRLIKKLSGEDEPNDILFNEIISAFDFIDNNLDKNLEKNIEALLVLKILSSLGYWNDEEDSFAKSDFNKEVLESFDNKRAVILPLLNNSLKATGLL
jgi:DNA repair protein RecO (recombination protein O)